jgi:SAM domain (Sterile alpha motif)
MDIVVRLRSLGLGKDEAAFRENEIDETILPNLTAEDLKELGVTALGHRRTLLDAIAALRTDTHRPEPSNRSETVAGRSSVSPVIAFAETDESRDHRRQKLKMIRRSVRGAMMSTAND